MKGKRTGTRGRQKGGGGGTKKKAGRRKLEIRVKVKKRGSAGEERMKGGSGRAVGVLKQPDTQQKHTLWLLETFQHTVDTHAYTHKHA